MWTLPLRNDGAQPLDAEQRLTQERRPN